MTRPPAHHRTPAGDEALLACLQAGIEALASWGGAAPPHAPTPCDGWLAHDLVRHLEATAGTYVLWASGALGGRIGQLRLDEDVDTHNALLLDRLPDRTTSSHLARWHDLATDHATLARAGPHHPMLAAPDGTIVTVVEHGGMAALEWHLHAWDLARTAGGTHEPSRAHVASLAAARTRFRLDPAGAGTEPTWAALLQASGRTP